MSKNYVKKHKGYAIPEGAEKFLNLCRIENGRHEFYKMVDGQIWYFDYDDKVWSKAKGKANYHKAEDLPKLPEQDLPNWDDQPQEGDVWIEPIKNSPGPPDWYRLSADGTYYDHHSIINFGYMTEDINDLFTVHERPIAIEDKEWLPEVGEECEALDTLMAHPRYCFAKIKGFYNKQVWITSEAGVELVLFINDLKFRPLKTVEEKEQEYNLCYLRGLQPTVHGTSADKIQDYLNDYTDMLVRAGITAPKGEG